jgi:hypothetical protein
MYDFGHASAFYRYIAVDDFVAVAAFKIDLRNYNLIFHVSIH